MDDLDRTILRCELDLDLRICSQLFPRWTNRQENN